MDCLNVFIRILSVCCLFFLFLSCDTFRSETETVTSGAAHGRRLVFSKQCSSGSFQVFRQTAVSGAGLSQLNEGDRVTIQGRVSNSSCYQGPVSFTCSARVVVDQNRSFICDSGTVQGGGYAYGRPYGTTTTTPGSVTSGGNYTYTHGGVPVSTGRAFLGGDFHTFGNGQQAYGRIVVGSSSQSASQAYCVDSFSCL